MAKELSIKDFKDKAFLEFLGDKKALAKEMKKVDKHLGIKW
jgi:hypothetical protein